MRVGRLISMVMLAGLQLVACRSRTAMDSQCQFNGDCQDLLVCAAGYCRAECSTNRDCYPGYECRDSTQPGKKVCLHSGSPILCNNTAPCPPGSTCAAEGICRRTCNSNAMCAPNGTCNNGLCTNAVVVVEAPLDAGTDAGSDVQDVADVADVQDVQSEACVASQTDPNNCGVCGRTCQTFEGCIRGVCTALPTELRSDGTEGPLAPQEPTPTDGGMVQPRTVTIAPGVHHYTSIAIPPNVVVTVSGSGVATLLSQGDVYIAGTINVSGGAGGVGASSLGNCGSFNGGGGDTGTTRAGADGDTTGVMCRAAGLGGVRAQIGNNGTSPGLNCGLGGEAGGGAGGSNSDSGGGGGGGPAGGGGGGGDGTARGGDGSSALTGTGGTGGPPAMPGGGAEPMLATMLGALWGRLYSGTAATAQGGGGGGSIGLQAVNDLAVSTTFYAGSGGGGGGSGYGQSGTMCNAAPNNGGGGGGGGGGGAIRIVTARTLTMTSTGAILANGGNGGGGGVRGGQGGGGSGGVVYLMAPSMRLEGRVQAIGGMGAGNGGLGRTRLSVGPDRAQCEVSAVISNPSVTAQCPVTTSATPGEAFVSTFPQ